MHKPYSIQVELVSGCTRQCEYCGLQAIWKTGDERKFMDIHTVDAISKSCGEFLDKARVEFAMFGEPTLHPELCDALLLFRGNFPKCQTMVNTNGDLVAGKTFQADRIAQYFECGLNLLAINVYDSDEKYARLLAEAKAAAIPGVVVGEYTTGMNYYTYKSPTVKEIIFVQSIALHNGARNTRRIWNHGGNVPAEIIEKYGGRTDNLPLPNMCVNPFREIAFRYDGTANICCMDVKGEYPIGNIADSSVEELWYSENMQLARRALLGKDRNFAPCSGCNSPGGFRRALENKWFDEKSKGEK